MGGLLWRGQSLVPASTGILAAFSPTPHLQLVASFSSAICSSRSTLCLRRRLALRRLAAPAVVPRNRIESIRLDSWPPCLGATAAALLCSTGPSRPHLGPGLARSLLCCDSTCCSATCPRTRITTGTACLLCVAVHDRPQAIAQPCPPHPTNQLPTAC